ncbi:hypothetical protein L6452_39167 [Arctium lappa]|uniref:Uncharacterized protein n=1 Tax=Arctium lappa TaxID=4217 RepID=A0ACB8XQX1_ARCLA|nr:hypothetical protein L6452_39167 [Arctium lappa]
MVSMRGRPRTRVDESEATASTADQPKRVEAISRPPILPLLGGGLKVILRVDLASSKPVIREAMAKQQEFLVKMLEDRDVSNRRNEMVVENFVVAGSRGTGQGNPTEDPTAMDVRQGRRACSYKSFMCSKPPGFSGSDDPIACMNWIREIEQAFDLSECEEVQKVKFGSQMLRGPTLIWWNVTKSTLSTTVLA